MSASNINKLFTVSTNLSILVGQTSDAISSARVNHLCVAVTTSATAGTTKQITAKLQASADGVAWFDVDATNKAVTITGDTTGGFADLDVAYPFIRLAYVKHADTTAATINAKIWCSIQD